jgi:hypothetical protein
MEYNTDEYVFLLSVSVCILERSQPDDVDDVVV